jgi:hypothetical protein
LNRYIIDLEITAFDKLLHNYLQVAKVNRLCNEEGIVGFGKLLVGGTAGGAKKNYWQTAKIIILPDSLQGFSPIHHWHIDIQNHQARKLLFSCHFFEQVHSPPAVGGMYYPDVIVPDKSLLQNKQIVQIIFGIKDGVPVRRHVVCLQK